MFEADWNPKNSPAGPKTGPRCPKMGQNLKQKDRAILSKPKLMDYMCRFEKWCLNLILGQKNSYVWAYKATNGAEFKTIEYDYTFKSKS